jgi:hypothetical protein
LIGDRLFFGPLTQRSAGIQWFLTPSLHVLTQIISNRNSDDAMLGR